MAAEALPIMPVARLLLLTFTLFASSLQAAEGACPRIISQSPYITKTLQWLELEHCIVGVSRYDTLERPHTGGVIDPDAEAIEALMPELILTSNWTSAERLEQVTPEGAHAIRLDGFQSMAQIEDNLRLIGKAAAIPAIEQRVHAFHTQWSTRAQAIKGAGKKVLLISSCSGKPYSFGKKRWLADLFGAAGFEVVETAEKIRHLREGETIASLNALINTLQPELLFIFERRKHPQCAMIRPDTPLQIINLDGEKFLHPAPVLLQGLNELAAQRTLWVRP